MTVVEPRKVLYKHLCIVRCPIGGERKIVVMAGMTFLMKNLLAATAAAVDIFNCQVQYL